MGDPPINFLSIDVSVGRAKCQRLARVVLLKEKEPDENGDHLPDEETELPSMTREELDDLEDEQIRKQIEELKEEEVRELERKRKKANKERQKLNERLNLKMIHKGNEGLILEGDNMFSLKEIKTHQQLENVIDQKPDIVAESDVDTEQRKPKKVTYKKDEGHLDSSGLYYKTEDSDSEDSTNASDDDIDSNKSGLGNYIIFFMIIYKNLQYFYVMEF